MGNIISSIWNWFAQDLTGAALGKFILLIVIGAVAILLVVTVVINRQFLASKWFRVDRLVTSALAGLGSISAYNGYRLAQPVDLVMGIVILALVAAYGIVALIKKW